MMGLYPRWQRVLLRLQLPLLLAPFASGASPACSSSSIKNPEVVGASILGITASQVLKYSIETQQTGDYSAQNLTDLNFCNVTVTYIHPGENDTINAQFWLPLSDYNGRFQAGGGGGFTSGLGPQVLAPAVAQGFAAGDTDGGYPSDAESFEAPWAWVSPNNVNEYLLQDFAARALHELAVIGKQVIQSAYGSAPNYSYWNGCSTGGRQGLMLAQRYPSDFDGILALAPAINWDSMYIKTSIFSIPGLTSFSAWAVAIYYPQFIMNQLNYYPPPCELDAITAAAIAACDGLDGVVDGIISLPGECKFEANTTVGKSYSCGSTTAKITQDAATIADATWNGARSTNGSFQWYGLNKDAPLTSALGLALDDTTCTIPGQTNCTGAPLGIATTWLNYFVLSEQPLNLTAISHPQWDAILHLSQNEYASIIGTGDPDLTFFNAAGGKMITWQGIADQLVFPNGTVDYYNRVLAYDPSARDYYRFFQSPGTLHCMTGPGPYPQNTLQNLISWVEDGVVPETLEAQSVSENGTTVMRPLCAWPQVQTYIGGNPNLNSSFACK